MAGWLHQAANLKYLKYLELFGQGSLSGRGKYVLSSIDWASPCMVAPHPYVGLYPVYTRCNLCTVFNRPTVAGAVLQTLS